MSFKRLCFFLALLALCSAETSAFGAELIRKGEILFQRRCVRCHSLEESGNRKLGPFLGKIYGRRAGTTDTYPHSEAYKKAGAMGLIWTEDTLVPYMRDPKRFLADFTKEPSASRMAFKLAKEDERKAIAAFLRNVDEVNSESAALP